MFNEIVSGIHKAKSAGINECILVIDTWAVDNVLLDADGKRINEVYAKGDRWTDGIMEEQGFSS